MCTRKYLYCSVCLLVCAANVLCKTIYLELNSPTDEERAYLTRYGYLPKPSDDVDFAYTPHSISEAVRKMQAFAGLPQTGLLDLQTRQLFKKKRCGVKDIEPSGTRNRRYIIQQGWNKKTITYRVLNGSSTLPQYRVEALMAKALAVWAPHGGLRFGMLEDGDADIKVSFARADHGDGFPFDGPGHVVAHAFQPPLGDMHFDDDESWAEGVADERAPGTDFFAVAVHEVGHALGLSHSDERHSVMYPYYQLPVERLHMDDILGMQELYMKGEMLEEREPEGGSEAPPAGRSSQAPRFTIAASEESDENEVPDLCYTNFDTLQAIQGRIFVFEEEWMWVIKDKVIEEGFPRPFHEVFIGLPRRVNVIKTIYENMKGNIVIFSGKRYWEFDPTFHLIKSGRLTDYLLPRRIPELTTVFLSNYNNKTYLIEEERFWRYDESTGTMDRGYPKSMAAWRRVPSPVDAALVWRGDTYFFRGPRFWRFDNNLIEAHRYYPLPTAPVWFPCPVTPDTARYFTNDEP